jgi:hypothetical protein
MVEGEADRRAAFEAAVDRVEALLNERANRLWTALKNTGEEFDSWDMLAFTTKAQAQLGVAHFMDDEEYIDLVKGLTSWLFVIAILHIDELEGGSDGVQSSENGSPASTETT